jgi:putative hydrolase of the HAD superfamily
MTIRAVIFDMGETLLRFQRPGGRTWREFEAPGIRGVYRYLVEEGHPIEAAEEPFVEAMFARLSEGWQQATGAGANFRASDWIAAAAAEHRLSLSDAALLEAVRRYARPLAEGVTAAPGARETLTALRERGIRTGLISNTIWPGELHMSDLDAHALLEHLEHLVFSGDAGLWKPNPAIFHHVLDALGVPAEDAVFVGDSPREDIVGAQRAGMRAVWVRSREFALGAVAPDAVIEDVSELLPALEQLSPQHRG